MAVCRRWLRRETELALALLLALGALALAGGSGDTLRGTRVRASQDFAAHVPSIGALRTPRDQAAPGMPRRSLAWIVTLLAVGLASAATRRDIDVRLAAHLRTRAPPELRFA